MVVLGDTENPTSIHFCDSTIFPGSILPCLHRSPCPDAQEMDPPVGRRVNKNIYIYEKGVRGNKTVLILLQLCAIFYKLKIKEMPTVEPVG